MSRHLAVLIAALLFACGCDKPTSHEPQHHHDDHAEDAEAPPPDAQAGELRVDPGMLRDLRVTTANAEARPSGEGVTALGELHVNEETYAEVRSPLLAQIVRPRVSLGDRVAAGDALVELRSAELADTRATYRRSRARLQLAEHAIKRKRSLAAENILPQRELQEAEAELQAAVAELDAARATLEATGLAREHDGPADTAVLRSPIAGTVIDRQAVQGQMAEPATALFRVADLSRLWLIVHAFERDAVRLPLGGTARVTFAALPGRTFSGIVTLIGKQVEVSSRTIPVRIEVDNPDELLRPGMSASAWLPLGTADGPVIAVPAAALQRVGDTWSVFLPRGEGAFEIREVGRGRDLGGEIEIVNGLVAGESVVVEGAFLLKAEADKARGGGGHHDH